MKKRSPTPVVLNQQPNGVTGALRILIVDSRHGRSLEIEKALNRQGYHRISPLRKFCELTAVIENALGPFDLLLISHEITNGPDIDLREYCRSSPLIRHFVIYGDPQATSGAGMIWPPRVQVNMSRLPDSELLGRVMDVIESP